MLPRLLFEPLLPKFLGRPHAGSTKTQSFTFAKGPILDFDLLELNDLYDAFDLLDLRELLDLTDGVPGIEFK